MFSISDQILNRDELHAKLAEAKAGAIVVFEGWVRNHNEGKQVKSLEYQVYHALAMKEGQRILNEAKDKFNLHSVMSVHREGHLKVGEVAIWIGATASHRDDAFKACRYVIDQIKHRLPVWKKEHYLNQEAEWVFCHHHHHHVHFNESEYYSKQAQLIDQQTLKKARVMVVGAGGLGCPVLINLASAGVGQITIVDHDSISISNIHRQFLFSPNLVGEKKAIVASNRLKELNPFIKVETKVQSFDPGFVQHDLVIDCTDNMQTKFFIHDVCLQKKVPLITAGIYKFEGQVRTIIPGKGCLRCHVKTTPDDSLIGNCNDFGVLGTTSSVIGSLQASEAIQFLLHGTNATSDSTLHMNLETLAQFKIKNLAIPNCKTCSGEIEIEEFDEVLDIRNLTDEEVYLMKFKKRTALACHRGIRSQRLVRVLKERGEQVVSFPGGHCSH